tara:strand:+ start:342 stop:1286 length:945 start_codon:yes stop_codon:yes gene_type:complete
MKNKLIVRIANGFGNQMFNYAAGYAFAKRLGYTLLIDDESSTYSDVRKAKKNKYLHWEPKYELSIFKITSQIAGNEYKFNSFLKKIYRKILIFFDLFTFKKKFLIEKRNKFKISNSNLKYYNKKFNKHVFFEGYFESENFFKDYKKDLIKEFNLKSTPHVNKNYLISIQNTNSVSIAVRRDRFSERLTDQLNNKKINESKIFEEKTHDYILNAVSYFESKVKKPNFFLFSDNFDGLDKMFDKKKFTFVKNFIKNKSLEDFYLMTSCKHFIVGPTSFHWWAAWLASYNEKLCVCPKNINPSNNIDFWPKSWEMVD